VLLAALGTGVGRGYERVEQILLAEDDLGGYSAGAYYLAFLGTPSTTGTWQLHFGGHHLAVSLTYKDGEVEGAGPFFVGVEPASWTGSGGTAHASLDDMTNAMRAMTGSLSRQERARARLSPTYADVPAGPGRLPATKQGLAVSTLTGAQKKLVLAAVEPWVVNADDRTAETLLTAYEKELDQTFVAWSGTVGLTEHADYVRIDGPSVWVELVRALSRDRIHYHAVYRDHIRDYGGEFTFA